MLALMLMVMLRQVLVLVLAIHNVGLRGHQLQSKVSSLREGICKTLWASFNRDVCKPISDGQGADTGKRMYRTHRPVLHIICERAHLFPSLLHAG